MFEVGCFSGFRISGVAAHVGIDRELVVESRAGATENAQRPTLNVQRPSQHVSAKWISSPLVSQYKSFEKQ